MQCYVTSQMNLKLALNYVLKQYYSIYVHLATVAKDNLDGLILQRLGYASIRPNQLKAIRSFTIMEGKDVFPTAWEWKVSMFLRSARDNMVLPFALVSCPDPNSHSCGWITSPLRERDSGELLHSILSRDYITLLF